MNDNKTATERLRELLDERGVEWKEYGYENHAWWEGTNGVGWYAENRPSVNGLYVKIEAVLTPEQAIAATLGSGTLTAEQVGETIERNIEKLCVIDDGKPVEWRDGWVCRVGIDYKAIADELNATLGSGECEFELNTDMSAIRCSACGYELPKGTNLLETRFCGGCGKAVKR